MKGNNIKGIKTEEDKWTLDLKAEEAYSSDGDAMTEVKLQKLGFVSSRESIEKAQEHFMFMLGTVKDKEDKFAMNLAFYVFWNTLADNYRIYKKEQK